MKLQVGGPGSMVLRRLLVALCVGVVIAALPATALGQERGRTSGDADAQRARMEGMRAQMEARRAQVEARVIEQFLERTAAELSLSDAQQNRLSALLRASAERHRTELRQAALLRQRLAQGVADARTSDAELARLLGELDALRLREHESWRADQRVIAEVLTPRQRAGFTLRWLRFQETVREFIGRRPRTARPGPPR